MEPVWSFLKKLKLELPHHPAIPLLGIHSVEKISVLKGYVHSDVVAALFTVAKIRKHPPCPLTEEWVKKVWYIHTTEYSAKKREGNPAVCDNVDEHGGH